MLENVSIFGFDLKGYGNKRLYGFLAESIYHIGLKNILNLQSFLFSSEIFQN